MATNGNSYGLPGVTGPRPARQRDEDREANLQSRRGLLLGGGLAAIGLAFAAATGIFGSFDYQTYLDENPKTIGQRNVRGFLNDISGMLDTGGTAGFQFNPASGFKGNALARLFNNPDVAGLETLAAAYFADIPGYKPNYEGLTGGRSLGEALDRLNYAFRVVAGRGGENLDRVQEYAAALMPWDHEPGRTPSEKEPATKSALADLLGQWKNTDVRTFMQVRPRSLMLEAAPR